MTPSITVTEIVLYMALLAAVVSSVLILSRLENHWLTTWEVKKSGMLASAVATEVDLPITVLPYGMMLYPVKFSPEARTKLTFTDGSVFYANGDHKNAPLGVPITVWGNGFDQHKIEPTA